MGEYKTKNRQGEGGERFGRFLYNRFSPSSWCTRVITRKHEDGITPGVPSSIALFRNREFAKPILRSSNRFFSHSHLFPAIACASIFTFVISTCDRTSTIVSVCVFLSLYEYITGCRCSYE